MHKRYTKDGEHSGARLVPGLRGEIGIKSDKFVLFQFLRYVRIDVQSGGNVSVSKGVVEHFYIYTSFTHSGGKGMPERMAAEVGEKYLGIWILS